jgi:hypothetical protein
MLKSRMRAEAGRAGRLNDNLDISTDTPKSRCDETRRVRRFLLTGNRDRPQAALETYGTAGAADVVRAVRAVDAGPLRQRNERLAPWQRRTIWQ